MQNDDLAWRVKVATLSKLPAGIMNFRRRLHLEYKWLKLRSMREEEVDSDAEGARSETMYL